MLPPRTLRLGITSQVIRTYVMAGSKHRRCWEMILPGLIIAFALSAMVYVGSALLPTINSLRPAEPATTLASAVLGFLLGIAGSLLARRNRERN